MLRRYVLVALLVLALVGVLTPQDAKANGCEVHTSLTTIGNLTVMGLVFCDANMAQWVSLATLISGEDQTNNLMRVGPGAVIPTTVVAAETTNTTSATFTLPAGAKTPVAVSTAAGAQGLVFTIYGAGDSTAANGISLCVITISVSTKDEKTCDSGNQITKDFPYYYYITTGASGSPTASLKVYNGLASAGTSSGGAVTNAGTFAVQIQTVGVEDAAETAGGSLDMVGTVRRDTPASSAGTTGDNATLNTSALGAVFVSHIDPCSYLAKTYVVINIATATTTQLVAASASNSLYVCSLNIGPTAGAQNIALIEDDTSACASPTAGMAGGVTAASGWNIAANGGIVTGTGGYTVFKTAATNRYVCLISSAAVQTSGVMSYVLAP